MTNKSGIHVDILKSLKDGGAVYFDGKTIYKEGKFSWE
jgi:hypothetical protein